MILSTKATQLELASELPSDVPVGNELRLSVTVQSESGQAIHGGALEVVSVQGQKVIKSNLTPGAKASSIEADSIVVNAPTTVGENDWLIRFPAQEIDGRQFGESTLPLTFETRPQRTSITTWGAPSTIQVGARLTFKVGAKSAGSHDISGARVEVRDATGTVIERVILSEEPWPGTALKWAEIELTAPNIVGKVTSEVALVTDDMDVPHEGASAKVSVIAVPAPNTRIGIRTVDQVTGDPLDDVRLGLGVHRGQTDSQGLGYLDVPDGTYKLTVWKAEYEPFRKEINVTEDQEILVALTPLPEEKEPWEVSY